MLRTSLAAIVLGSLFLSSAADAWPGKPPKDDPPPPELLYEYIGLGNLGGDDVYTNALNNAGDVVGRSWTTAGGWHAFLCSTDATGVRLPMVDLNDFLDPDDPVILTHAFEVNDAGQVVGQADLLGTLVAYLFTPPSGGSLTIDGDGLPVYVVDGVEVAPDIQVFVPPFAVDAELRDVNSVGTAVGTYRDASGAIGIFVYDDATGVSTDLGAPAGSTGVSPTSINDALEIAGTAYSGPSNSISMAWKYTAVDGFVPLGVLDDRPSDPESIATNMNAIGEVIGSSKVVVGKGKNPRTEFHGFLYTSGTMSDLGNVSPGGINTSGDIVVRADDGLHILYADPSLDPLHLNAVTNLPEALLSIPDALKQPDINDAGVVAGASGESFSGVPEEVFLLVPLVP